MLTNQIVKEKKRIVINHIKLILLFIFMSHFTSIPACAMYQGETEEGQTTAKSPVKSLCVYCSASADVEETHLVTANNFGKILAQNNIKLVYGGGHIGMMGQLADGCLKEGGYVHGIIPEHLQSRELGHKHIQNLEVVPNMHIRKAKMFESADAVVVLAGGYGTLDETLEVLTWRQLGVHNKPIVILNHEGFWDPLRTLLDHLVAKKFASQKDRQMIE